MANTLDTLKTLLLKDERLVSDGELLKNKAIELAIKLDPDLIKLLLSDKTIKAAFFTEVSGALIFDKDKFIKFISNKQFLPDSYTAFTNKIGLTENGEFISEKKEVVLSWPYKDCLLEGGQTKEDAKRDEVFWNQTLAPDEISRLLDPKVFTNAKRIDKTGEHKLEQFKTDADGNIKDNLIIKGNNLLALHSLKYRFAGKVKLIYTDPPFNTTGAANTFSYNNSFNHSTWLVFMKNRLEAAKIFLKPDGIIVIAIDHAELLYLGVIADEVFGRENRLGIIAVETNPRGRSDSKFFATSSEYFLVYAKDEKSASINHLPLTENQKKVFKLQDNISKYRLLHFQRSGSNSTPKERPNLFYPIYFNIKAGEMTLTKKHGFSEIIPKDSKGQKRVWRQSKESFEKAVSIGDIIIKKLNHEFIVYLKDRIKDGRKPKTIWVNPLYDASSHGTILLQKMFNGNVFSYPKSIHLIKDILKITTVDDDIVLDFFSGSGTTAQAVLELNRDGNNRKFILCEQMDYVDSVTKERVKKVIGNDSFIYLELGKWNENFVDKINKSKSTKELAKIWEKMKKKAFLSYKVDPKTIDKNAKDFAQLSLTDQKRFLLECLDKNQMYINYSEIDDDDYKISNEDRKINKEFYRY